MIYPSMEERRLDWITYPCFTEEFTEQRAAGCHCTTCLPGRAGGKPSGEDTPTYTTAVAAQEAREARDAEPLRQPIFEAETIPPETPAKTTFPFAPGERESGWTPLGAEGWQRTNARVSMAYDEPGRSKSDPIQLATPTRDKQA